MSRSSTAGKLFSGTLIVLSLLLAAVLLLHRFIPNRWFNLGSLIETFLPWFGLAVPVFVILAAIRRRPLAIVCALLPGLVWFQMYAALIPDKHAGEGDFRVLTRRAVRALLAVGEYNRFSKGLFSWIGFDTAVVDYENVSREAGATKWRLRDLFNYGIDGVVSFNYRPLRLSIWFGVLVTAVAIGYALWVLVDAVVHGNSVPGYVTTICAVTAAGKALTPCAATPWLPANTTTRPRSIRGRSHPCQPAKNTAISSSRPSEPAGLVSWTWRAAAAAVAAASGRVRSASAASKSETRSKLMSRRIPPAAIG